ncbi:MAG: hypothetical protein ABL974_16120 [Prosthecobacter sp.]
MRASTRPRPSDLSKVITRWRGLGAVLAVAFYSLFFAAHLKFFDSPVYVRDGLIFGARSHTVFNDLTTPRSSDHSGISPLHPAFTLLHQPLAQLFTQGWLMLGQDLSSARKHGVAMLTCLAGALAVVMVFHTLLWAGSATMRAALMAMVFGASTCAWIVAPLPETWTFAGLGMVALIAVTARGPLAHPAWHLLASVYAISTFFGSIIPCLIVALTRCAQDRAETGHFKVKPLLVTLAAVTISFGLANVQRQIYPSSKPLPKTWQEWCSLNSGWQASRETQALVAREVFISNIVAPPYVTTQLEITRPKVVLSKPIWSMLDLRRGLSAGWLLILVLAFAGLVWRAQLEPFTLGVVSTFMWSIATLSWYGQQETLLLHACLWTGLVVIAAGLGLERALAHWSRLTTPITLFLAIFVSTLIMRNWMFIQDVADMPGR